MLHITAIVDTVTKLTASSELCYKMCLLYFEEDKKTDKTDWWVDVCMPVNVSHHHHVIVQDANHAMEPQVLWNLTWPSYANLLIYLYIYINSRVSS